MSPAALLRPARARSRRPHPNRPWPSTGAAPGRLIATTLTRFLENANRHFAGLPVVSPL